MTTRTTPPAPGLTREDTGMPHPHYAGWNMTPAYVAALDAREDAAQPGADPDDIAERFRHLRRGSKTVRTGRRIA